MKRATPIRELFSYRDFLLNLTVAELKLRYRDSLLGFLWTVLNPLFFLLILSAVFSLIIRFQVPDYPIFLFSGLVSWLMIQQTVTIATASVVNNQAFLRKVYVPKLAFPVSNVLARYTDHVILVLILLVFLAVRGAPFTWSLAFLPVAVAMHFFFSLGLSLLCAVAYIKIRDTQHVVAIVFQALFYATPVLYPLSLVPDRYRALFRWNPFSYFVEMLRYPVYEGRFPPGRLVLTAAGLSLAVFVLGLWTFLRKDKYFVFHLS
jgi:ABC-type polysaccharide/polyol phosphate export permease